MKLARRDFLVSISVGACSPSILLGAAEPRPHGFFASHMPVQLLCRYSYLDLNDNGINGGQLGQPLVGRMGKAAVGFMNDQVGPR